MRRLNSCRVRWHIHPFRDGPQSDSHSDNGRPVGQISPDKDVNFCYMVRQAHHVLSLSKDTTAAFTLSPESGALVCCAHSAGSGHPEQSRRVLPYPGDWAFYAISVRRLIALHSGFLQTLPHGNAPRGKLGISDLPSASTFVNMFNILTGFTYRGLPLP
jgi:hypothetical protein